MAPDDLNDRDAQRAASARHRLGTLALTAAALGLATATLVLDVLGGEAEGTSPLLTIAVLALALNGLRSVERDGADGGTGRIAPAGAEPAASGRSPAGDTAVATGPDNFARERAKFATGVLWHVGVFVVINAVFLVLDLGSGPPGAQWALWISLAWGVGVAFHLLAYLIQGRHVERRLAERFARTDRPTREDER